MASSKDSNDLSELLADALNDFNIEDSVEKSNCENKPVQESMEDVLKMLNNDAKTNNPLPSNDEDLEKMFHEFAKNLGSDNVGATSADQSSKFFMTYCLQSVDLQCVTIEF